ncbi:MAG: transketolase family protein [Alphaproteobacteria bacterium]|nr:transketolase family protein [Alphaproteobacteria bacterium]
MREGKLGKYDPRPPVPKNERMKTSAMIASLAAEGMPTITAPFGKALVELAEKDEKILGLSADLAKYTDIYVFRDKYPDRFYQMGMAEQALVSAAAGLAREGFQPFATTYAVFAARRAYDFICMAIAEENLDVKIVAALPGLTSGYGPSHQATEDIAIFRGMPNMTIIDPCCGTEIMQATHAIAAYKGPVYMRLLRGQVPDVLSAYDYQFELGKAKMIRDGRDALFISTGLMTMRALEAAKRLEDNNIDCGVLHVPTIKPLDTASIIEAAGKTGRMVVVAENHTVVGGLGEGVARILLSAGVTPEFRQIALPDAFLDAGALPTLHDRYGLSVDAVCAKVKGWLG